MKIDKQQLSIGSSVYHIALGYGSVTMINANSALASFNGQTIGFNAQGKVNDGPEKVVGLARPLIVWGNAGEDVAKLVPLVQAGVLLMGS